VPGRLLSRQFYARDALDVARDLLGQEFWQGAVGLRITEVEAYRYPDDSANHCRRGLTARNAPMWGPPGHAYVYLCYGLHQMLNLVTNRDGEGGP
jgi:DNA-3-methyladenine glycosylase